MYQSSVDALMALDQHAIEELRSYRNPPEGVHKVMSAVCMLFDVPMTRYIIPMLLYYFYVIQCLIARSVVIRTVFGSLLFVSR
jgi:hypothetical protein